MLDFSLPTDLNWWQALGLIVEYAIKIWAVGYVPEGRKPAASSAWLLAILLIPIVGLPLFLLMGSPYINRRRHRIQQEADAMIEDVQTEAPDYPADITLTPELKSIIRLNRRLTRLPAVAGYSHGLESNYEVSIREMASAIDKAEHYVHVEMYILAWDSTTDVFFQALKRAVDRGVQVRLLFDQVGSWKYKGYLRLGRRLTEIGVDWRLMLPLQPWRWRFRRPDLRNHRKLIIIDGHTGFMGSQNIIEAPYLRRSNRRIGREWKDVMVELTGPVVQSMNMVFAVDWYSETDQILDLPADGPTNVRGVDATTPPEDKVQPKDNINILQLVPSGPGYTTEPNLRLFNSVVHHAKERLVLCSPYFIPDESLLESVTTACYRGVRVELLVNEEADQFVVDHAQSSYYQALLEAGVHIYRYPKPAILHSKFILADPDGPESHAVGVVGSSNMDMRSFGLNYEVSLLVAQGNLIKELNALAHSYIAVSEELTLENWRKRGFIRRYIDNVMRLTSALQ